MKTKTSNLLQVIRAHWYLILQKKGFWFSFWIMLLLNVIIYLLNVWDGMGKDIFQMHRSTDYFSLAAWLGGISYIAVFFPFLVVFPVALVSFDEELGKSSAFGILRCSYVLYYAGKAITAFLTGCVIIWVPFGLNILWNTITFRGNVNGYEGMVNSQIYFLDTGVAFEEFYKLHPLGYEILFVVLLGMFAGVCSLFAYCVCNYVKQYKVFCVLPVFILFFVTRALDFRGLVLEDYMFCPLGRECIPTMFIVEGLMVAVSCILLARYTKEKEFL